MQNFLKCYVYGLFKNTREDKIVIFMNYKFRNRKIVLQYYFLSYWLTYQPHRSLIRKFDSTAINLSLAETVFHIVLHFYREVSESRTEEKCRFGKRMSSYIETRSFVLIGEQKQKFARWKYHSIPVKYKPSVSSAIRVQTDSKSDQDTLYYNLEQ